jgi:hypothetical protein
VRTAKPAFSMAIAIDSREPVSSSITRTRGFSAMPAILAQKGVVESLA